MNKLSKKEGLFYVVISILMLISLIFYVTDKGETIGTITLFIAIIFTLFIIYWLLKSLQRAVLSRDLALILFSLVFSVFFIEQILTYVNFYQSAEYSHQLDLKKKLKKLINSLDDNINAHIRVAPYLKLQDKNNIFLSDITNEVTILGEEEDGMIVFKSDENGFRNKLGAYDDFDVLLLGDSFIESAYVPENRTIHYNLIKNGYKTYNAGISGTGLAHFLATFIEYGIPKEPKFVILNISESFDINRMHKELNHPKFMEYYQTQNSNKLLYRKEIQNNVLNIYSKQALSRHTLLSSVDLNNKPFLLRYFPQVLHLVELIKVNFGMIDGHGNEGIPACRNIENSKLRLKNILEFIRDKTKTFGGNFAVSYIGTARHSSSNWNDCEYKMVKSLLEELKIPFIDMVDRLNRFNNPNNFFAKIVSRNNILGHYNSAGYKLFSDELINYINIEDKSKYK
jgi:hypothetical protein